MLDAAGISEPPVPVDELATADGIRLAFEPMGGDDVSGMLYRRGSTAVIVVNEHHPPNRQRFTIAHEIGHFRLHDADAYLDGSASLRFRDEMSATGTKREEREANAFAACLLMPADWVSERFIPLMRSDYSIGDGDAVIRLAEQFEVSEQAMRFRLVNLGLIDLV